MNSQHTSSSKNLILGLAKGYPFEKIKPFLVSLRNSGYKGDVCLFVADLNQETLEAIQEYDVQLQDFKEWSFKLPWFDRNHLTTKKIYPYHRLVNLYPVNRLNHWLVKSLTVNSKDAYIAKANILAKFAHIMCVRYPLYYLYLSEVGKNYSNIMLSDVRDVLFQRDPFDFEIGDHLCGFFEEEQKTLISGEANADWLRQGFGEEVLAEIGDRKILCAGTTIGSSSAIMQYLEAMVDNTIELKCHTWGIDQGVHNYILHKGLVQNVKFYDNYRGPVLTMHYSRDEKINFDKNGFLLNEDGSIINVLHQYDRKTPEFKNKMRVYRESECL